MKTASEIVPPAEQPWQNRSWPKFAAALCGIWLAANTSISDGLAIELLVNNILCGLLICLLSLVSLNKKADWLRWFVASIGTWLLFSPLVFWAPSAFHYDGSTLIGALVIAFSFLIPGQPGTKSHIGRDIPPGWSYNPSSWRQRLPLIAIAFIGFFLARYLAAYQLGYIDSVWDPFFGDGTERVLKSDISKAFVISDAGLGAVSYLIDALEGFLGNRNRWRTMPWAVVIFAASIVPAGVTSVVLVMLQPIGVGAWCSICLLAAMAMLIMVPFAFDELVATVQFLLRSHKRGESFWHTFIFGGTDVYDIAIDVGSSSEVQRESNFAGVNFPWNLIASALLGIWFMTSPALLSISQQAADSQQLIGALITTIAVTAMAEPCRAVRLLNILSGVWLLVCPLLLSGFSQEAIWINVIFGIILAILSVPKGKVQARYGTFDKFVF